MDDPLFVGQDFPTTDDLEPMRVFLASTGEELQVTAVSSHTMTWPWGLNGPTLHTSERRGKRPRAWLGVRSRRIRIPRRLARRWRR